MIELTAEEIESVSGGQGIITWLWRAWEVYSAGQAASEFASRMYPPGGTNYVTDPSSIGARNGSDAMSDNHETW